MATGLAKNKDLKLSNLFDFSNYCAVVRSGDWDWINDNQAPTANGCKVHITKRLKKALEAVVEKYSTGPGKIVA
jgi:hypothetical protein